MCASVVGGDIVSFLRAGGLFRYVDGMSTSYVYFDGDSVVDYATLNAAGFLELVFVHAKNKENRILWEYLKDRAELFMNESAVKEFKKWADQDEASIEEISELIATVCERNEITLRKEPLE